MKRILILVLLMVVLSVSACTSAADANEIEKSASNEEFEIVLHLDKDVYSLNEEIKCYAELRDRGSETITVYSANPLLGFGVKDDKYFDGVFITEDILKPTVFEKGETQRFEFTKSGGYSSDDSLADFYKEYYSQKEFVLPKGEYEISAIVDYSLDVDDIMGTNKRLSVSVVIVVK